MVAKKTIKIKESDLHKIISKVIAEVSYNYHIGNIEDVSNIKPYYSDNKKKMIGRVNIAKRSKHPFSINDIPIDGKLKIINGRCTVNTPNVI